MIEIIIDDFRLTSVNNSKSTLAHETNFKFRFTETELCKMSLLSFIEKNALKFELKEKQYIFIKPCKTSKRFIYDLHAVTNPELRVLLQRHLNLK
jgi:hypothetical protein